MPLDQDSWRYHPEHGARLFSAGETVPAGWKGSALEAELEPEEVAGDIIWRPKGYLASTTSAAPETPATDDEAAVIKAAIPENWRTIPWFSLKKLVTDLTGEAPANKAAAVKVIEALLS